MHHKLHIEDLRLFKETVRTTFAADEKSRKRLLVDAHGNLIVIHHNREVLKTKDESIAVSKYNSLS